MGEQAFWKESTNLLMLPTHSGSRDNGIRTEFKISKKTAITLIWILFSAGLMIAGYWSCRVNGYNFQVTCDETNCVYKNSKDHLYPSVTFPRGEIISVEYVKIRDGDVVVPKDDVKKKGSGKTGQSLLIRYRAPAEPNSRLKTPRKLLFTPHDMGRRPAKDGEKKFRSYLTKEANRVDIVSSRFLSPLGSILMLLGFLSFFVGALLGDVFESPKVVKKKA